MSLDIYLLDEQCDHCKRGEEVFEANITHNLNKMAGEAGIYEIVWRPEEAGVKTARELIEPLTKAILEMKDDPARFQKHNAKNGWGLYIHFLPWLEKYLAACIQFPDAGIYASR